MLGFKLWNTNKLYAPCHHLDGVGDDYNPSLYGLGLITMLLEDQVFYVRDVCVINTFKSDLKVILSEDRIFPSVFVKTVIFIINWGVPLEPTLSRRLH